MSFLGRDAYDESLVLSRIARQGALIDVRERAGLRVDRLERRLSRNVRRLARHEIRSRNISDPAPLPFPSSPGWSPPGASIATPLPSGAEAGPPVPSVMQRRPYRTVGPPRRRQYTPRGVGFDPITNIISAGASIYAGKKTSEATKDLAAKQLEAAKLNAQAVKLSSKRAKQATIDQGKTYRTIAYVGAGVAVAALLTAVVLKIRKNRRR